MGQVGDNYAAMARPSPLLGLLGTPGVGDSEKPLVRVQKRPLQGYSSQSSASPPVTSTEPQDTCSAILFLFSPQPGARGRGQMKE